MVIEPGAWRGGLSRRCALAAWTAVGSAGQEAEDFLLLEAKQQHPGLKVAARILRNTAHGTGIQMGHRAGSCRGERLPESGSLEHLFYTVKHLSGKVLSESFSMWRRACFLGDHEFPSDVCLTFHGLGPGGNAR